MMKDAVNAQKEFPNYVDCTSKRSFIEMKEDLYGKDLLTFACDTCNKETADSFVVSSPTRPRNR